MPKLPSLISEVQHCIDGINQKEALAQSSSMKQIVNEALMDITFKFDKLTDEEMKIVAGEGEDINQKWQRTIKGFADNIDPEDPEYMSLREAFLERFKEHGFVAQSLDEYKKASKDLDEVLKKIEDLQKKNKALLNKYNGDVKFARTHKRIREENEERAKRGKKPVISTYDSEIMDVLKKIKTKIDQQVYDRNDILKKDAYFEQTVMKEITEGLDSLGVDNEREDRIFIQSRIATQYLSQYRNIYVS